MRPPIPFIACLGLLGLALLFGYKAAAQATDASITYFSVPAPAEPLLDSVRVGVYLPPGYPSSQRNYPVLYFLHGWGGNETSWAEIGVADLLTALIRAERVPPFIVVTPSGEHGGFSNWIDGKHKANDFLLNDLIPYIDQHYRTQRDAKGRGVSGASMGGGSALRLGMQHPERFGAVSSHSAALHPADPADLPDWAKDWEGWAPRVGKPISVTFWQAGNPLHLAQTQPISELAQVAFYFDAGTEDHLGFHLTNDTLSTLLDARGVPHTFALRPGGHGNAYFRANVEQSLLFHGKHFAQ